MNMVHLRPTAFMRTPERRHETRKPRFDREAIQLPTSSVKLKSHSFPYFLEGYLIIFTITWR